MNDDKNPTVSISLFFASGHTLNTQVEIKTWLHIRAFMVNGYREPCAFFDTDGWEHLIFPEHVCSAAMVTEEQREAANLKAKAQGEGIVRSIAKAMGQEQVDH